MTTIKTTQKSEKKFQATNGPAVIRHDIDSRVSFDIAWGKEQIRGLTPYQLAVLGDTINAALASAPASTEST